MSGGGRKFDALLTEGEPQRRRFDGLLEQPADDGFQSWSKPGDAGSSSVTSGTDTAGNAQWSGGSALGDAAYAAAGGVFSGLGVNPGEAFGDQVANRIALGEERSPIAAPVGKFGGEVAGQVATGLGPLLGGVASGIGNTEGGLEEKARGGVVGGVFGKLGGMVTGKLSSLLNRGAAGAEREAVSQGLMHSGATRADLGRLDDLGGREYFAEGAQRLGLTGRASKVANRAGLADEAANAERGAIEQAADVDQLSVDPSALGGNMRQRVAEKFPGITPAANAADTAAGYVDNVAPSQGQGAPWKAVDKQRQYWGEKANFASGSPENQVRQQMHGAVNQELGDALSLQTPGAGDRWQQLGRDQQIAKELGGIASAGADRARDRGFGMADAAAGGLGALLGGGNPLAVAGGIAARRGLAANQHAIMQGGAKLGALTQRGAAGALQRGTGAAAGELGANAAEQQPADQAALDLIYSPSQGAELGQYKAQFFEAAGASNGPDAVKDLITRLTMTDPQFRTTLLPLLSGRGGMR